MTQEGVGVTLPNLSLSAGPSASDGTIANSLAGGNSFVFNGSSDRTRQLALLGGLALAAWYIWRR